MPYLKKKTTATRNAKRSGTRISTRHETQLKKKTCWPCCSRPRFISWLCCCMSGFEYYGFSKVRKIATPLAEKTEKLSANFSLSLNLSGNATVSGNTGAAVGVDNTYIANVRSASNDTILQDHYTGKDQQHRTPTQI